ncbi:MAG TPA: hypothetical protein VGM36_14600 [Rhizomicrobium sp.]
MTGPGSRFLWCLPAVFVLGVMALAISWTAFYIYHPAGFVGTLPSISETISTAPGSIVFQSLMLVIAPCIVGTWLLNFNATKANIEMLAASGRRVALASALNCASRFVGILAGAFLAGLTAIRLHDGSTAHHWHIWLSEGFYSTQVIAFLIDSWCATARRSDQSSAAQTRALYARWTIGLSAIAMSLFFLRLYISRQIFADPWLSQAIYVSCEYLLATLCFAYPMAQYTEVRAYYGGVREEALA